MEKVRRPRDKAVEYLLHYLSVASRGIDPAENSDCYLEIGEIVDAIIEAARSAPATPAPVANGSQPRPSGAAGEEGGSL